MNTLKKSLGFNTDLKYVKEILSRNKTISNYKKVQIIIDDIKDKTPIENHQLVFNYVLKELYSRWEDDTEVYNKGISWPIQISTIMLLEAGASHRQALSYIDFKKHVLVGLETNPPLIKNFGILSYAIKRLEAEVAGRTNKETTASPFLQAVLKEFSLDELSKILKITPALVKKNVDIAIAEVEFWKIKEQEINQKKISLKIL